MTWFPFSLKLIPLMAWVCLPEIWGAKPGVSPGSDDELRRFALVVGANDGGRGRVALRYAQSDAEAFASVIRDFGGVKVENMVLLRDPGRARLLAAIQDMQERMEKAKRQGRRVEMLVYYSGHSDERALLLGGETLSYSEFRILVDAMPAKIRLVVVDACASGSLTRGKGGDHIPAFAVDQSASLSGYAFLTSSSGSESSQESDRIRASFFTHFLLTGLRGAADRNLDGKVTLAEAYEFAFHETLSQTEGTQAGAQHPGYDMRLTGSGDWVLTDLRGTSASLVLDPELTGRLFVRSASGNLVAELQKQKGKKVALGVDPGLYDLRLDQGKSFYRALIKADSLTQSPLRLVDFEMEIPQVNRLRGGSDSETSVNSKKASTNDAGLNTGPTAANLPLEHEWVPTRFAIIPPLGYPGFGNSPYSHHFSLNLLIGGARDITGWQASGLINYAGKVQGMQWAGLANTAIQVDGVQFGLVNAASHFRGLQLGVINAGGDVRGLQLGLVNMANKSHGIAVAPIILIGNGIHDAQMLIDETGMMQTQLLLGGPYNYFYYSFDFPGTSDRHAWGYSGGLGAQIPYRQVFADLDLGAGRLHSFRGWEKYSVSCKGRLLVGVQLIRYLSLFAGVSHNLEMWPASKSSNLHAGKPGMEWGPDIRAHRWTGFFAGLRL